MKSESEKEKAVEDLLIEWDSEVEARTQWEEVQCVFEARMNPNVTFSCRSAFHFTVDNSPLLIPLYSRS